MCCSSSNAVRFSALKGVDTPSAGSRTLGVWHCLANKPQMKMQQHIFHVQICSTYLSGRSSKGCVGHDAGTIFSDANVSTAFSC